MFAYGFGFGLLFLITTPFFTVSNNLSATFTLSTTPRWLVKYSLATISLDAFAGGGSTLSIVIINACVKDCRDWFLNRKN